jgi:hypothetical protein
MNTLFDMDSIPEKQADSKPSPEFVITFTDTEGVQWFYSGGIETEGRISWVQKSDRKLPKRYKALHHATRYCKELNRQRTKQSIAAGITARVVVWVKA